MRRYVDHVLALLPFEPAEHERLGGPRCSYVGHPLVERVAELRPSLEEAKRRNAEPPLLLVLPGSRSSEISRLAGTFGETLRLVANQIGPLELVLPTVPHLRNAVAEATRDWSTSPRIIVDAAEKAAAFRTARAALAKSGTVTLELAIAGIPMVTAYNVSLLEELIAKPLIKVSSVILANLVLGQNAVPEFIQRECTPEKLAAALVPLLRDSAERAAQTAAFARLDEIMEIGTAKPAFRAAEHVLAAAGRH
jgi:lipid-A-disaccharide synthase